MIHSIQTHHCRTEMPNASPTESQGCNGNPQKDEKVISIWIGFCFSIILRCYWLLLYHHMLPSFQKCTLFGYSSPDACQAKNQPCNHHSAEVFLPRSKCLIRVEFGKAKKSTIDSKTGKHNNIDMIYIYICNIYICNIYIYNYILYLNMLTEQE